MSELSEMERRTESVIRVLFIGAGAVNFGGAEGPWDHSKRLEKLGGVEVVGIADPDLAKARSVLQRKLSGEHAQMYMDCVVEADYRQVIEKSSPQVAFIGVPPLYHGSAESPQDIELQCLRAGLHVFIEKPVSVLPPEKFWTYVQAVEEIQREKGLALSVGYMFRYHPAICQMKSILEKHGRPVMGINARYICAYSEMDHPFWWNKAKSGGPVVEQATHFCDLMRFLVGEVLTESISALAIPASDEKNNPGFLSAVKPVNNEASLGNEHRIPRLTSAHWFFTNGAIGNLIHAVALHGSDYEAAIEVWADGLRMSLEEPYFPDCKLRVRRGKEKEEIYCFPTADSYMEEDKVFLQAVLSGDHSNVCSSYEDAYKTYNLSWLIRRSSESPPQ